jgi:hypothetical protein
MKDVTTTSFGLLMAYLFPGVAALCCVAFWWSPSPIDDLFKAFLKSQSNFGSFLFVVVVALLVGLQLNALRWFIYEKRAGLGYVLTAKDWVALADKDRLIAVKTTIDENYRYHQFYGSMSLVIPFLVGGWIYKTIACRHIIVTLVIALVALVVEYVTIASAHAAISRYGNRVEAIIRGNNGDASPSSE